MIRKLFGLKNISSYRYLAIRVSHHGVHGDEDGAAGVERQLHSLKLESLDVVGHGMLNGVNLLSHNTQHSQLYPVELIKTRPCSRLSQTLEELAHGVVVQTIRTVEHDALLASSLGQVLTSLSLAGASHPLHCTPQVELESAHESAEASVSERSDNQTISVAEILETIVESCVDHLELHSLVHPVVPGIIIA